MKTGRWAALSGLIGSAAILLAACGGGGGTTSTQAPLQKANEVVFALPPQVGITDFAPIASSSAYTIYNSQVEYMLWAPVVMVSSKDTIDWADSLAKSITPNANDSQFTVQLNNWNWSNGTPITAQDVAFTANTLIQACTMNKAPYSYGGCGFGGLPPSSAHSVLESATATGTHTVVFKLNGPSNPTWFELNGLGQIQPMPASIWNKGTPAATLTFLSKVYNDPTNAAYKVISGPYAFKNFVNNQYWSLVPNAKYGGHKASVNLTLQYETSEGSEFAALKTQKVNAGYITETNYGAAGSLKKNFNQTFSEGFCWYGIMLNSANDALAVGPAFQDVKVREALQLGIDENAVGKVLFGTLNGKNLWIPTYSAIPLGFDNLTNAVFGVNQIPSQYQFNIQKGIQLLESDGYKMVGGVMTKGNTKLAFPMNIDSGSQTSANAALVLQQDWAKEGVKVTINPVAFDTLVAVSNQTPGESSKWAMNDTGGWCYEPNFYPTGGGMWGYYDGQDSFNNADFQKAVNNEYLPGTAQQAQQHMLAYGEATANDLPFLWQPGGLAVNETAPYIQGYLGSYNPVQAFFQFNYVTISH